MDCGEKKVLNYAKVRRANRFICLGLFFLLGGGSVEAHDGSTIEFTLQAMETAVRELSNQNAVLVEHNQIPPAFLNTVRTAVVYAGSRFVNTSSSNPIQISQIKAAESTQEKLRQELAHTARLLLDPQLTDQLDSKENINLALAVFASWPFLSYHEKRRLNPATQTVIDFVKTLSFSKAPRNHTEKYALEGLKSEAPVFLANVLSFVMVDIGETFTDLDVLNLIESTKSNDPERLLARLEEMPALRSAFALLDHLDKIAMNLNWIGFYSTGENGGRIMLNRWKDDRLFPSLINGSTDSAYIVTVAIARHFFRLQSSQHLNLGPLKQSLDRQNLTLSKGGNRTLIEDLRMKLLNTIKTLVSRHHGMATGCDERLQHIHT